MIVAQYTGGEIKICVDLPKLSKFAKIPTHPGVILKKVLSDIPLYQKASSTQDAIKGLYHLQKSFKSWQHSSDHGREYKWPRTPMGLSSRGDKYNLLVDAVVDGLAAQNKALDDILLFAEGTKVIFAYFGPILADLGSPSPESRPGIDPGRERRRKIKEAFFMHC